MRLSKRQITLKSLLESGKYSVTQITNILGYSDPRGHIRTLRDKGINVKDVWVKKKDVRFKIYWI